MKRSPLPALLFSGLSLASVAQDRCVSQTISERWLQQHGQGTDLLNALHASPHGIPKSGGIPTIPVAVHVVWNIAEENIPASEITGMIAQMNLDYQFLNADLGNVRPAFAADEGNANIAFCLATSDPNGLPTDGITRTQTTDDWFDPSMETDDMKSAPKGIAPWDPTRYMNIWICDIASGLGGGLITTGYSYLPVGGVVGSAVDGLVIDYNYGIGNGTRTGTHETGHYLGLLHPWADGGCGSDDGMADTPVTDSPTFTCSNTALMKCSMLTQYENFMDYADCTLMFTNDQGAEMTALLNGARASLLTSNGCSGTTSGPCIPFSSVGTAQADYIDDVQLGTIINLNSGSISGPSYTDYTAIWSTTLNVGGAYDLSVTSGGYIGDHYAAWIDYNVDHVFGPDEKLGEFTNVAIGETHTFTFTIPVGATLGDTRMRVRGVYHSAGDPDPTDPCFNYTYGETEDYAIAIQTGLGVADQVPNGILISRSPGEMVISSTSGELLRDIRMIAMDGRITTISSTTGDRIILPIADMAPGVYVIRGSIGGSGFTSRTIWLGNMPD